MDIPGLSLSILRQDTRIQPNNPLLISGRLTAFGMGVPAFIRVTLYGPSYDPQTRSFDTFASPFSGDYSVNVVAEKGGSYEVYAQAFPPPAIPSTALTPDAVLLLPAFAESTHPPIAVGDFTDLGVEYLLPDGSTGSLETPAATPIEVNPYITVAPGVTVYGSGVPSTVYATMAGLEPAYYEGIEEDIVDSAFAGQTGAVVESIMMSPSEIEPGQVANGILTWRNTSSSRQSYDIAVYLLRQAGSRYGPVQVISNQTATPQVPQLATLRFSTVAYPSGIYSIQAEIYNRVTGEMVDATTIPYALTIRTIAEEAEIPIPEVPEVPEVPEEEEIPELPTMDILGQPTLELPREITVGDTLSGSVSLPTAGLIPYYLGAQLVLISPEGQELLAGQTGATIGAGQPLNVPVSLGTYGFTPGSYGIFLYVADQYGTVLKQFDLGSLSMLAAAVEELAEALPEIPEAPALPTKSMLQTPNVNLPRQVTIGDIWAGSISIPTTWPATLPAIPSLPAYNYAARLQLESPTGRTYDVRQLSGSFVPGKSINIPVSFNTGVLSEAGMYDILLNITDIQGNSLWSTPIGMLEALKAAVEEVIGKAVTAASKFTAIQIDLGASQVEIGQTLNIPITYTHVGKGEMATIRAGLGDMRLGVYDEIGDWAREIPVSVPDDATPTAHKVTVSIPIRQIAFAAGTYTVEAKVDGLVPRVLTRKENLVQVIAPKEEVAAPSQFTSIQVNLSPTQVKVGDQLRVPVSIKHVGAAEIVTLYAAIGQTRFGTFDEILHATERYEVPQDASATTRGEEVIIPITSKISAGTYNVYAKITGKTPETVSPVVTNVVEVIEEPKITKWEFPNVNVSISSKRVKAGDTVTVPVSFSHEGLETTVKVYAAIGQSRAGFDEILHGSVDTSVPTETTRRTRTVNVPIRITTSISPGVYGVYGKIQVPATRPGWEKTSNSVWNVITVYKEAAPTYNASIGKITASPSRIKTGDFVIVSATVKNLSSVTASVKATFKIYEGSILATHGDYLGYTSMSKRMAAGESYTFQGGKTIRSDASRFDVECEVTIDGKEVASREDDDVFRKS